MAVAVFYSLHKKSLFVAHSTNNFLFLCSHNLKKVNRNILFSFVLH